MCTFQPGNCTVKGGPVTSFEARSVSTLFPYGLTLGDQWCDVLYFVPAGGIGIHQTEMFVFLKNIYLKIYLKKES